MRRADDPASDIYRAKKAATCDGKFQHDRKSAKLVALKTRKVKLHPYYCRFCGHWHVGSDQRGKSNEDR